MIKNLYFIVFSIYSLSTLEIILNKNKFIIMLEHSTQYRNWCFKEKDEEFKKIIQNKLNYYRKIYQKIARYDTKPANEIQVK